MHKADLCGFIVKLHLSATLGRGIFRHRKSFFGSETERITIGVCCRYGSEITGQRPAYQDFTKCRFAIFRPNFVSIQATGTTYLRDYERIKDDQMAHSEGLCMPYLEWTI